MDLVERYARDVVEGRVLAGKYHRLSCARHLKDLARQNTPEFPYRFDLAKAERVWRFAEKLKHYKGEWAGQFIVLRPDQKFRKGSKFGWVHVQTGLRRFRNSYEEIPRKNGKSLDAAVETLYATFFDGEGGAEGYCAGTKRDQALIVFNDCKKLVTSSGLKERLDVRASNINHPGSSSKLEPLSADYNSLDGLNISFVNLDELHAYKHRGLIDVVETATGSRRQPLVNKITTAGSDPVSPCGDEHDYACKVLDGVIEDDTYFAFIAHADLTDDWTLPETAAKANPSYGISVKPDDLSSKVRKAKSMPSAAATYKQKHLNLWVNSDAPWLSIDGWRAGQSTWETKELLGEPCWAGVDLSSKIDLTAVALVFPPTATRSKWRIILRAFTPADTLDDRAHRDRAPYRQWVDQGWLTATPGTRIDHQDIRDALIDAAARFQLRHIAFDPWNAGNLPSDLQGEPDNFSEEQIIEIPQTFAHMSAPSKEFEADVLGGIVDAGDNPLMTWMVSNAVVQKDGKDNIQPIKKRSRGRIDGVVAAIMGRKLAIAPEDGGNDASDYFEKYGLMGPPDATGA